jgi:hypothetical protein
LTTSIMCLNSSKPDHGVVAVDKACHVAALSDGGPTGIGGAADMVQA